MQTRWPHQEPPAPSSATGRLVRRLAIAALAPLLVACASTGIGSGDPSVVGDEKGGKIAGGVSEGNTAAAMRSVTAHCAQYGKKAFITQMESPAQGGLMVFVCLQR
jgi:hypothetical protein